MSNDITSNWIPEIMYEDDANGMTSKIPFIMVPDNQTMPEVLFIFESRETGEFFEFSFEDIPSVRYYNDIFIHNYPGILFW